MVLILVSGDAAKKTSGTRPVSEFQHQLSASLTTFASEKNVDTSVIEESNSTAIIKTAQSPTSNENCYRSTLTPILNLLKQYDIVLKENHVKNTVISRGQISLDGIHQSRTFFEVILNVKVSLPPKLDGKITNETYYPNEGDRIDNIPHFKFINFNSMERANLLIISENHQNMKSTIKIRLETDINETYYYNLEINEPDSDDLSQLFVRRNTTHKLLKYGYKSTYFGLVLALVASTLCGLSFVLKKRSLLKMDKTKAYYQNKGWWTAHSLVVVGDILHFIAFFFTPAVLICTMQMLMVMVTAVSSTKILGEKINNYWKLAFASSLGGCLVIIVHVPKEPHITNIETFLDMVSAWSFLLYISVLFVLTVLMTTYVIPRWGRINSLAYAFQSAIFGSVLVIALKGVLIVFSDRFFHWLPLTCFAVVGICLLMQLEYLNRALTYYNTLVVVTQYYVLYSALVIFGSSLLFDVWKTSTDETLLLISLGFSTITLGVLIFAIFQEDNATFDFSKLFTGPDVSY